MHKDTFLSQTNGSYRLVPLVRLVTAIILVRAKEHISLYPVQAMSTPLPNVCPYIYIRR
jgi:hypothetical protein